MAESVATSVAQSVAWSVPQKYGTKSDTSVAQRVAQRVAQTCDKASTSVVRVHCGSKRGGSAPRSSPTMVTSMP